MFLEKSEVICLNYLDVRIMFIYCNVVELGRNEKGPFFLYIYLTNLTFFKQSGLFKSLFLSLNMSSLAFFFFFLNGM